MISIVIEGVPPRTTAQQKGRNRFGHYYKTRAIVDAEKYYKAGLKPFIPPQPISGAVVWEVTFIFPAPSNRKSYGASRKQRAPIRTT